MLHLHVNQAKANPPSPSPQAPPPFLWPPPKAMWQGHNGDVRHQNTKARPSPSFLAFVCSIGWSTEEFIESGGQTVNTPHANTLDSHIHQPQGQKDNWRLTRPVFALLPIWQSWELSGLTPVADHSPAFSTWRRGSSCLPLSVLNKHSEERGHPPSCNLQISNIYPPHQTWAKTEWSCTSLMRTV